MPDMYWIPHPLVLQGRLVRLEPLQAAHIPALVRIARSPEIWEHLPHDGTDAVALERELRSALIKRSTGEQYPFTVFTATGAVAGSTRFFDLFPEHKKLEIGWTWYDPLVWGTGINLECKYLLLEWCFEKRRVQRVQLKTRTANLRSQGAIRKLGAVQEGILRKDRISNTGETRDTVVFSIIDDDWPAVKARLQGLMAQRTAPTV